MTNAVSECVRLCIMHINSYVSRTTDLSFYDDMSRVQSHPIFVVRVRPPHALSGADREKKTPPSVILSLFFSGFPPVCCRGTMGGPAQPAETSSSTDSTGLSGRTGLKRAGSRGRRRWYRQHSRGPALISTADATVTKPRLLE